MPPGLSLGQTQTSYNSSKKHMDPQPSLAVMFTAQEPRMALTPQKDAMSMRLRMNGNTVAHIPHACLFPVVLRRKVLCIDTMGSITRRL
jgi:hypothetical protein